MLNTVICKLRKEKDSKNADDFSGCTIIVPVIPMLKLQTSGTIPTIPKTTANLTVLSPLMVSMHFRVLLKVTVGAFPAMHSAESGDTDPVS